MPRVTEAYRNENFDPKILAEMVSFEVQSTCLAMMLTFPIHTRVNLACSAPPSMGMDVLAYRA
jgi:hypothetical protein